MVPAVVRAPLLLHLGLEEVPTTRDELVSRHPFEFDERRVIAVVVLLDDLERPPSLDDVAADELGLDPVGEIVMPGAAQLVDSVAEGEVGLAGEPVEGVQVAAGVFGDLERLGQLAECRDSLVGDPVGADVLVVRSGRCGRCWLSC